jgi:hypothetical protein
MVMYGVTLRIIPEYWQQSSNILRLCHAEVVKAVQYFAPFCVLISVSRSIE